MKLNLILLSDLSWLLPDYWQGILDVWCITATGLLLVCYWSATALLLLLQYETSIKAVVDQYWCYICYKSMSNINIH